VFFLWCDMPQWFELCVYYMWLVCLVHSSFVAQKFNVGIATRNASIVAAPQCCVGWVQCPGLKQWTGSIGRLLLCTEATCGSDRDEALGKIVP